MILCLFGRVLMLLINIRESMMMEQILFHVLCPSAEVACCFVDVYGSGRSPFEFRGHYWIVRYLILLYYREIAPFG
jgi:hypothetical protein